MGFWKRYHAQVREQQGDTEHESPYAIISDCCSSYTYKGMGIYINMLLYYTVYIYIYQYSLWTKCISLIICVIAYPYRWTWCRWKPKRSIGSFGAIFWERHAALLVIGGVAMSFHFSLLYSTIGGVPPTIAIGDPVWGKSTAVECAMAIFDQRDCIGGIQCLNFIGSF